MDNLITFDLTDAGIKVLQEKYTGIVVHYGDTKAEKYLREAISDIRVHRTSIEKRRRELKAGALQYGRKVDAEAARITKALEIIEIPLKLVKDEIDREHTRIKAEKEAKEKARITAIKYGLVCISNRLEDAFKPGNTSEYIGIIYQRARDEEIKEEFFQEFYHEANSTKLLTLNKIEEHLKAVITLEVKQKEEQEKVEKIRQENERLKRQQQEVAADLKRQKAAIAAEKEALEKERLRISKEILMQNNPKLEITRGTFNFGVSAPLAITNFTVEMSDKPNEYIPPIEAIQEDELELAEVKMFKQYCQSFINGMPNLDFCCCLKAAKIVEENIILTLNTLPTKES